MWPHSSFQEHHNSARGPTQQSDPGDHYQPPVSHQYGELSDQHKAKLHINIKIHTFSVKHNAVLDDCLRTWFCPFETHHKAKQLQINAFNPKSDPFFNFPCSLTRNIMSCSILLHRVAYTPEGGGDTRISHVGGNQTRTPECIIFEHF